MCRTTNITSHFPRIVDSDTSQLPAHDVTERATAVQLHGNQDEDTTLNNTAALPINLASFSSPDEMMPIHIVPAIDQLIATLQGIPMSVGFTSASLDIVDGLNALKSGGPPENVFNTACEIIEKLASKSSEEIDKANVRANTEHARAETLQTKLDTFKNAYSTALAGLTNAQNEALTMLKNEYGESQTKLMSLLTNAHHEQLARLNSKLEAANSEVARVKSKLRATNSEVARLKSKLEAANSEELAPSAAPDPHNEEVSNDESGRDYNSTKKEGCFRRLFRKRTLRPGTSF